MEGDRRLLNLFIVLKNLLKVTAGKGVTFGFERRSKSLPGKLG